MAYEFLSGEPVPDAVRRIYREQLDRIGVHLAAGEVHEARKRMKETRALLRLVRGALGDELDVENGWLRDAAHSLTAARDAEAMIETLEKLRKGTEDRQLRQDVGRAKRSIRARTRRIGTSSMVAEGLLAAAQARLPLQSSIPDRFSTIGTGLERTYRSGRRAFDRASDSHSPSDLHTLRRRVKDQWYQLRLLQASAPEVLEPLADVIKRLSDLLGEHHDLTILRDSLPRDRYARLLDHAQSRREELEKKALALVPFVFAEKPKGWRDRLKAYWKLRTPILQAG